MVLTKIGMTLIEIIVVLMMVAIATVFFFPNFAVPSEHARAVNVQNNLLAIYSAQQNYNNNNNAYCVSGNNLCGSLAAINTNLSLNIQDDGTYSYICTGLVCTATRTSIAANNTISVQLNLPIQLTGNSPNPSCTLAQGWCP